MELNVLYFSVQNCVMASRYISVILKSFDLGGEKQETGKGHSNKDKMPTSSMSRASLKKQQKPNTPL